MARLALWFPDVRVALSGAQLFAQTKRGGWAAVDCLPPWQRTLTSSVSHHKVPNGLARVAAHRGAFLSLAFMRELGVQAEAWAPFAEGRNNLFQNPLPQIIAKKARKTHWPNRTALDSATRCCATD